MPHKIFFQSSLPRSGSTLFQNIIAQNSDFYVTPTSGVLELVYAARANYSSSPEFKAQDKRLMEDGFRAFCKSGVEGYYNAIAPEKKYVLDKSRGWGIHHDFLNFFYPDPKIVCLVRDPKDIFASMEKKFRSNPHIDSGIIDHAQMKGTTTEKRIDIWCNSQPVGLALERLYQIINQGIDKKMLFIKYENLCHNPNKELERFYDFIKVDFYYKHHFDNIEQVTKEDDDVYGIYGDHNIKPNLKSVRSDARDVLGKYICDWIANRYNWFYDYFKYNK